jgi:hypothetical protein
MKMLWPFFGLLAQRKGVPGGPEARSRKSPGCPSVCPRRRAAAEQRVPKHSGHSLQFGSRGRASDINSCHETTPPHRNFCPGGSRLRFNNALRRGMRVQLTSAAAALDSSGVNFNHQSHRSFRLLRFSRQHPANRVQILEHGVGCELTVTVLSLAFCTKRKNPVTTFFRRTSSDKCPSLMTSRS